jgi:hypothetical protein
MILSILMEKDAHANLASKVLGFVLVRRYYDGQPSDKQTR